MSISTPVTAEQLLTIDADGLRRELVCGEIRTMTPAGFEHGQIVMELAWRLKAHAKQHGLGTVVGAETGLLAGFCRPVAEKFADT